ncbi:uncharacterized protein ACRADG_002577 [Cochliomyia hominivorax]
MRSEIKCTKIILTIICFWKLPKTIAEEVTSSSDNIENHQVFLNQIEALKHNVARLETDFGKLHNGLQQQAGIIYEHEHINITDSAPEISSNHSEQIQEFYKNFNIKFLNLNNITEESLQTNNNLLWNKTQKVALIIDSLNKCVATKREMISSESQMKISKLNEKLENQMKRVEILSQKLENFSKNEENLEKSSENLSKILNEIFTKLESQDKYYVNMGMQLPILQGASKTLDDYLVSRNEHFSYHERCKDGNCPRWHRHHHHHRF